MSRPKVFVVHGHAVEDRDKLFKILTEFNVEPVVMEFATKKGRSIYEEFYDLAKDCEFAFVLLTPDDKMAADVPDDEKFRARQNVIFEMGWFYSFLGREKTRLLYRGTIEIPSDVTGVVYIKFNETLDEVRSDIRSSLEAGGVVL